MLVNQCSHRVIVNFRAMRKGFSIRSGLHRVLPTWELQVNIDT